MIRVDHDVRLGNSIPSRKDSKCKPLRYERILCADGKERRTEYVNITGEKSAWDEIGEALSH
jgi:hypothetical protein